MSNFTERLVTQTVRVVRKFILNVERKKSITNLIKYSALKTLCFFCSSVYNLSMFMPKI